MTLTINRLRERITIEQPNYESDGQGGQDLTWSTLAAVYAEVVPMSSYTTARNLSDAVYQTAGYRVTIRNRDDVTGNMRLQWKTRTLKISALHEREHLLEILAYEESL